jgi:hypothetical protein
MYWLLSSFATDAQGKLKSRYFWRILVGGINISLENVRNGAAFRCIEAVGQAVAYGMNTQTTSDPIIGLYVLPRFAPCKLANFWRFVMI